MYITSYEDVFLSLRWFIFFYFINIYANKHAHAELLQLIPLLQTHLSEKFTKQTNKTNKRQFHATTAMANQPVQDTKMHLIYQPINSNFLSPWYHISATKAEPHI